jgi:hypothetical protein
VDVAQFSAFGAGRCGGRRRGRISRRIGGFEVESSMPLSSIGQAISYEILLGVEKIQGTYVGAWSAERSSRSSWGSSSSRNACSGCACVKGIAGNEKDWVDMLTVIYYSGAYEPLWNCPVMRFVVWMLMVAAFRDAGGPHVQLLRHRNFVWQHALIKSTPSTGQEVS